MTRLLLWTLLATPVLARVGGGQDYGGSSSGSSSSSGGGGGGGDAEAIFFLIEIAFRLVFYYPKIGIPLLIIGFIAFRVSVKRNAAAVRDYRQVDDWSRRRVPAQSNFQTDIYAGAQRPDLERLKAVDPNFSRPLFLDFVNLLYSKAYLSAGEELSDIGGYLSQPVRQRLARTGPWRRVIVGGLRVTEVSLSELDQKVVVEVEANLDGSDGESGFVVDRLVLQRQPGVSTPAPETVYSFSCPNCGNTSPVDASGRCTACQNQVNNGRFGWLLTDLSRERTEPKQKVVLSSHGEEAGTDRPTVQDSNLEEALQRLHANDPSFSLEGLAKYASDTFLALQAAWTEGRWEQARPLETDYLFGQHQLWMEAYADEGLRNVLDDVEVMGIELARVEKDRYFEAVTLRIHARMKDSTVRVADGAVLSGDPRRPREFSEYWTFVRRAGVTSKQREVVACPNCGAGLDRVTVAGVCEYCEANITRGDFDWVLSRIEQDEAYQ